MTPTDAPFMLYIPFNANATVRAQWRVLERSHVLGVFASRNASLDFALRLAAQVVRRGTPDVRLLVEEATGEWTTIPSHRFIETNLPAVRSEAAS